MLTLADLLIALKNRLRTAMEQHDLKGSEYLRHTFTEILEASYGIASREQCAMLENLEYAANHVGLADWKAEDAIPSDEQIKALFVSTDEKPE